MTDFSHINRFVVRTPYYTLGRYHQIPKNKEALDTFIDNLFNDAVFKEAIFLASPELFYEWRKSLTEDLAIAKKNKIQASILKYFMRASTRSTPFGLFSGYTELKKEETFDNDEKLKRFSGIDLHFLYTIVKRFNADLKVRKYLTYSPNTTMYKVGGFYRYIEYIIKNQKREHSLIELEADEVLELIFDTTSDTPKSICQITEMLSNSVEGVTEDEIIEYVKILIDSQILVSDLDIIINNESPLNQIILFFEKNIIPKTKDKHIIKYHTLLVKLQTKLVSLDANTKGNSIRYYEDIFDLATAFKVPFEKKFLINTNLHKKVGYEDYKLESKEITEIKKAINTLSLFSFKKSTTNLDDFKTAFYKRYEDQEIPLCIALDNEIGIGYLQKHKEFNSFSSLIDDIKIKASQEKIKSIKYHNKIHEFWSEILSKATKTHTNFIDLKQEDLSSFKSQLHKLSNSFYVMLHKVVDKISIKVVGGSSALNLIGRFASSDSSMSNIFQESATKEKEDNKSGIVAELLHVPDNRSGNILLRNVKRDFEVSFLTKGNKDIPQITIDDLYISLKNNKLILRSKKYNKKVKIINTTAHNYEYNALPIYQFLGDLQLENTLPALALNIGMVNRKAFNVIPRITYGNIILSPGSWSYKLTELTSFYDITKSKIDAQELENFISDNHIPRFIILREGSDNTIRIDLKNPLMHQFLEESIRKNKKLKIEEALYDENEASNYMAEYIIPFFKKDYKIDYDTSIRNENIKRSFIPGEEWLYYKIYTGAKTANKLLINAIKPFIAQLMRDNVIKKWHFIRFKDPDFHIRLRFQLSNDAVSTAIITKAFNKIIESYVENHFVWKVELATYNRELERYGWDFIEKAESVFFRDSEMVMSLLAILKKDSNIQNDWLVALKSIDGLYDVFDISLEKRHHHITGLYNSFLAEFEADRTVKKQIEAKFRLHRKAIESMIDLDESSVFYEIIKERNRKIIADIKQENLQSTRQMKKNITSFIHMYINRMAISNPRMHELVIYGLLAKHYSAKIGKEKYSKPKSLAI